MKPGFYVITHNGAMPADGGLRLGYLVIADDGSQTYTPVSATWAQVCAMVPAAPARPRRTVRSQYSSTEYIVLPEASLERCLCGSYDLEEHMITIQYFGTGVVYLCQNCGRVMRAPRY